MSLPTFTPTPKPSPGTNVKRALKLLQADFGDGYTQPAPDGLNHMRKTLDLNWTTLTPDQMHTLDDFLAARGGTEPFYYTPAGHTAPLKWTCAEWETKLDGTWSMSATFVQNFTNAT